MAYPSWNILYKAEIRTHYLPNSTSESYSYTNLKSAIFWHAAQSQ